MGHLRSVCLAFSTLALLLVLNTCSSAPAPAPATTPSSVTGAPPAAAAAAASATDPNAAKVYIYRTKEFAGFALRPTVMLDGHDLINVKNGTVWVGNFKPGHYKFQMDDKKSGAEVDLKPGDAVYFRVDIVPGFWKGGGKMTMMAKEQGSLEVQNLTPLPPGEVADPNFKTQ
ncbi:MAG TPA: DUF2846 domain-containing protein [Thermoanaerobaculia bacterium]